LEKTLRPQFAGLGEAMETTELNALPFWQLFVKVLSGFCVDASVKSSLKSAVQVAILLSVSVVSLSYFWRLRGN